MAVGFFRENALQKPYALKVFAPKYCRGVKGYEKLNRTKVLTKNDVGFSVIAGRIKKVGDKEIDNPILEIRKGKNMSIFPDKGFEIIGQYDIGFARGWSNDLQKSLEVLKNDKLFFWGKIIFGIGFICTLVSGIISIVESTIN